MYSGDSRGRVHVDSPHSGKVDNYSIVTEGTAADIVASTTDCRELIVLACKIDGGDYVRGARAPGNQRRLLFDTRVPYPASTVVAGITWLKELTMERRSEDLGIHWSVDYIMAPLYPWPTQLG